MRRSEAQEQQAVAQWARMLAKQRPELGLLYHVPNEAKRSPATAALLKSMGMEPGVPDLILDYPAGAYHGLRVELKVGDNRPTPAQRRWLLALQTAGYAVACVWSANLAIRMITEYINLWPGGRLTCDTPETREKYGFPAIKSSSDWKGTKA